MLNNKRKQKMNFKQFLLDESENREGDHRYATIVTLRNNEADEVFTILKNKGEGAAIKYMAEWDDGSSEDVVFADSFGKQSYIHKKGAYVLVYDNSKESITLYRKED